MTICFAAQSLAKSAAVMSGVQPLTSPPIVLQTFDPLVMTGHELVFFKLHGFPGQPFWYGDGGITALSAQQLESAQLAGALVFAANCWGGPNSPMVRALIMAGAACVVTGEGVNYAGVRTAQGADNLGRFWRWALALGATAETALQHAKTVTMAINPRLRADVESFSLVGNHAARLKGKALWKQR